MVWFPLSFQSYYYSLHTSQSSFSFLEYTSLIPRSGPQLFPWLAIPQYSSLCTNVFSKKVYLPTFSKIVPSPPKLPFIWSPVSFLVTLVALQNIYVCYFLFFSPECNLHESKDMSVVFISEPTVLGKVTQWMCVESVGMTPFPLFSMSWC